MIKNRKKYVSIVCYTCELLAYLRTTLKDNDVNVCIYLHAVVLS